MKISRVLTMNNLYTGENEEVKLDTKEIRDKFNFLKKDCIIDKVFIDNLWLKITLLVWLLILSALLILAKISQNYGFLLMLILISLITITLVANFDIIKLYFLGDNFFGNSVKKRSIIKWSWKYTEKVGTPSTELEGGAYNFLEKAVEEINKIVIRFYLSHLAVSLVSLFVITILISESQPDKRISVFIAGVWILMEFYLWMIRRFIMAKAEANYSINLIVDDNVKESAVLEVEFLLNGNYIIEEEIKLSKCIKVPSLL